MGVTGIKSLHNSIPKNVGFFNKIYLMGVTGIKSLHNSIPKNVGFFNKIP